MKKLKILVRKAPPGSSLIEMHPWWVVIPDPGKCPILIGYESWREALKAALIESKAMTR